MDTPVEPGGGGSYDPGVERRLSRLEGEMREVKSVLGQMMPILARIEATLASTLPHLATKAELADLRVELRTGLADKPGKAYLWGVVGVLVAAIVASYGAGLAAIALLH
ncbi:MAG TPA: hypothetical protein VFW75_10780 [Acetobacteraceae bacterium]|nr:hypothetical protein [Acetobacteraceae bacterium]